MKIIQIDGFRGLITAAFVGVCLFAGFVLFPGYVAMNLWNQYLVNFLMFPQLSLFQGVLLWGMVFVSYSILTKGRFALSLKHTSGISDAELDSIIKSAQINSQMQKLNKTISKADRVILNKDSLKSFENKTSEEKDLSYISSPISLNKNSSNEQEAEEEKVS